MIHARDDYNRIQDPAGKIPEDEPVFLLRAQDQLACMAVAYYATLCEQAQSPEIAAKAREHADRMAAWPVKKVPDLPAQEAALSQGTRQAEPVALSPTHERAAPAPEDVNRWIEAARAQGFAQGLESAGKVAAIRDRLAPSQPVAAEGVMLTEDQIDAIEAALDVLDAFGESADRDVSPEVWLRHRAEERLAAARAALSGSAESKKGE